MSMLRTGLLLEKVSANCYKRIKSCLWPYLNTKQNPLYYLEYLPLLTLFSFSKHFKTFFFICTLVPTIINVLINDPEITISFE